MNFIKYLIYSSIILSTEEILLVNWLSLNILNVHSLVNEFDMIITGVSFVFLLGMSAWHQ